MPSASGVEPALTRHSHQNTLELDQGLGLLVGQLQQLRQRALLAIGDAEHDHLVELDIRTIGEGQPGARCRSVGNAHEGEILTGDSIVPSAAPDPPQAANGASPNRATVIDVWSLICFPFSPSFYQTSATTNVPSIPASG